MTICRALYFLVSFVLWAPVCAEAQKTLVMGRVLNGTEPVPFSNIKLQPGKFATLADSLGHFSFSNIPPGNYQLKVSAVGFRTAFSPVQLASNQLLPVSIALVKNDDQMDEVVVTGTLKEVRRIESPVPVEVYSPAFFRKNPTPNIFEALQNVNGVRPQLNCNVCNTGDIHINGLEGPYTMVLVDGMPIVSSLSTVYGLSGIPNSLVERIEIVKGPASSLYGSEAVGGLINIITKNALTAPALSLDVMATSWQEMNTDLGFKFKAAKGVDVLTGLNYFKYGDIVDQNKDGFTDVTLQDRVSLFQKWNFGRTNNRAAGVAARYFNEYRWGGDTRYNKSFRGGDSIYGESIYTRRWELMGNYQLPTHEKLVASFSFNQHNQDSRYGTISYIAKQQISFAQLTWDKTLRHHDVLAGVAVRHTFYDDNTAATATRDTLNQQNQPDRVWLPGVFLQDEITLGAAHKLLLGFRYDHNQVHGAIFTPRLAYKWSVNSNNILRLNAGTGFRVVNLFTEDHAALTGARFVEIRNELNPEKSYNVNLNYIKKIQSSAATYGLEFTSWYTFFNNRILADYDTDPNKIIYDNLDGYAESKGVSLNIDAAFTNGLKLIMGATYLDVATVQNGIRAQQILTEKFSGTWALSYRINPLFLSIDYTGNIYGPMRLPLLGALDPRRAYSPTWSIQNIQFTCSRIKKLELYAGIKNLLNWTPNKGNPFIIARSNDPFDKGVEYDANGAVLATPGNPFALSFDPSYVYAPNQGLRGFFGIRLVMK